MNIIDYRDKINLDASTAMLSDIFSRVLVVCTFSSMISIDLSDLMILIFSELYVIDISLHSSYVFLYTF